MTTAVVFAMFAASSAKLLPAVPITTRDAESVANSRRAGRYELAAAALLCCVKLSSVAKRASAPTIRAARWRVRGELLVRKIGARHVLGSFAQSDVRTFIAHATA